MNKNILDHNSGSNMHHTKTKSRELQFKQSYSQVSGC